MQRLSRIKLAAPDHGESPAAEPKGATREGSVLTARGIEKSYRRNLWSPRSRVQVLTGAEITLGHGEVVGLVGENGSGKSMLMGILVGDLRADAGTQRLGVRLGTHGLWRPILIRYPATCY